MNYAALLQLAGTMYGQEQANKMTKQQLDLLGQQIARIQGVALPDLPSITPDQLGPSAMGEMAPDEAMRGKQLQALGDIQNVIDHGGTDLTMENSLEQAMNAANVQQQRARAGVAADMQHRGQLNGGARMVMDLDAAGKGADAARASGTEAAAQASQRRLQAINEAAGMEGNIRGQDWGEKSQAATAKDMRDQYNAAAREKAQYYNAGLPQQGFNNAMAKATGTGNPTNAMAGALQTNAATAAMNGANMGAAMGAGARMVGGGGTGGGSTVSTFDPESGRTVITNPDGSSTTGTVKDNTDE